MKRNLLTLAGLGILTVGAHAAITGNITLQGKVDPITAITVAEETSDKNVSLGQGISDSLVATVTEICNSPSGYTINLPVGNALAKHGSPQYMGKNTKNTDTVPYSITYGGAPVAPSATGTAETTGGKKPAAAGDPQLVKITF